uniref:Uncharacterized protein n=1 Tax=Steinernema glaseri TaxID=37863 RepID=A0A1I7ZY65_9BILA
MQSGIFDCKCYSTISASDKINSCKINSHKRHTSASRDADYPEKQLRVESPARVTDFSASVIASLLWQSFYLLLILACKYSSPILNIIYNFLFIYLNYTRQTTMLREEPKGDCFRKQPHSLCWERGRARRDSGNGSLSGGSVKVLCCYLFA